MSDDLVKRLRSVGGVRHDGATRWYINPDGPKAADRIEKLVEENGVLFVANIRLNSRADLDSDGYVDRIEKLEAALREITSVSKVYVANGEDMAQALLTLLASHRKIALAALEGKDD